MIDGSAGKGKYFEHQRMLVSELVKLSSKKVRFGAVVYGGDAKMLSHVTADHGAFLTNVLAAKPPGGIRDVAKAETFLRLMRIPDSPHATGAPPKIAVLLLGGSPSNFKTAEAASKQLLAAGFRVVVGLIDDGSSVKRKQACALASQPCSANVEAVKSWEQMAKEPKRFLTGICRDLVYGAKK